MSNLQKMQIAAERELRAREKHLPAKVAAGAIVQDEAEADLAAWAAIAALVRDGTAETPLDWRAILAAATAAQENLLAAAIAARDPTHPDHPRFADREARLGAVVDIRRTLERAAWRVGQCLEAV
jgi:hypothetical protein